MVAEAKNVARAFGDSWKDQFPFNNTIAPPLRFLPINIRRLSRRLYFELETRAQTADTQRSTSGPLLTSLGITAMYAMSDSMHRNLARFVAVASVEVARRLQRMFAAKRAASPREAYDELPAGGLDVISMDNINVRDKHGVLKVARGEKGFDGIAVQGVGWLDERFTDRDKKDPYRRLPRIYRSVSDIERHERKALMDSFLVDEKDADMEVFRVVLLGMVYENSARLDGTDLGNELSFRKLLLSSFHGFKPTQAKIVFIRVTENDGSEEMTIMANIDVVKRTYGPAQGTQSRLVVIEGDQVTFNYIFKAWLESYRRNEPEGLHTFCVVIPGHWHMDKTGITPMVKLLCCGSGVQELLKNCGLSATHIANFEKKFSHWRKSRQVLNHVTAASCLEAIDLAIAEDPAAKERVEASGFATESVAKQALPVNYDIRINWGTVKPSTIVAGYTLLSSLRSLSRRSKNVAWHIGILLLDVLIPYSSYNVMARLGQTRILDKFYFFLAPLLELTSKQKYQVLSLQYGFMKYVMPPSGFAEIFTMQPGKLVTSPSSVKKRKAGDHLLQDELQEIFCIAGCKRICRRPDDARIFRSWPSNAQLDSAARCAVARATGLGEHANHSQSNEFDCDASNVGVDGFSGVSEIRVNDKERRGSGIVWKMRLQMRQSGHLQPHCMMSGHITNYLAPERERKHLSTDEETSLLSIFQHSKNIMAVHASHLFRREFGPPTQKESEQFLRGDLKYLSWSKRHARSFSLLLDKANPGVVSKEKAKREAIKQYNARKAELRIAKDALMDVIMDNSLSKTFRDNSVERMNIIKRSERLVTPHAQAYRAALNSQEGRHSAKNRFWPTLSQISAAEREHCFMNTRRSGFTVMLNVLHVDLMNAVNSAPSILSQLGKRRTGLQAVDERLKVILGRHLDGTTSSNLALIHLHIDTPPFGTLQKLKEQQRRDSAQFARTGVHISEQHMQFDWDDEFDLGPNTWSMLLRKDRREKDTICSFLLLRAAIVIEALNEEWNERTAKTGRSIRKLRIFLHGGCFAIHRDATSERLSKLRLKRCGEGILVCPLPCATSELASEATVMLESQRSLEESCSVPYERTACFELIDGVLRRYTSGDSKHPETDTRIVRAHCAITKEQCMLRDGNIRRTYVSSWDSDVPMIILLSPGSPMDRIWVEIRENVFDLFKIRSAITDMGITTEELALVFALGGSDFTFGTLGVSQHRYLRAYMRRRSLRKPILKLTLESPDEDFDTATLLAFLDVIESSKESRKSSEFLYEDPENVGSPEWRMKARIRIEKSDSVPSADAVPPEAEDVFLQARRCKWLVRMWSKAKEWDCSGEAIKGCDLGNGFDPVTGAGSFEEPAAVVARKQEIAIARQIFCRCKANSGKCSGRCGCKRRGNICLPGCGCGGRCLENTTIMTPQPVLEPVTQSRNAGIANAAGRVPGGAPLEKDPRECNERFRSTPQSHSDSQSESNSDCSSSESEELSESDSSDSSHNGCEGSGETF